MSYMAAESGPHSRVVLEWGEHNSLFMGEQGGANLWSSTDAIFSGVKWPSPANRNRVHRSNALMVMGQ